MKKISGRKLLVGCVGILLLVGGFYMWQVDTTWHLKLNAVNTNFGIDLPTSGEKILYEVEDRGWMGDGQSYHVWRYRDQQPVLQALNWRQGAEYPTELPDAVLEWLQKDVEVDENFLPQELGEEVFYYWQKHGADGYGDNQLFLLFAPQATLRNGQSYENVLFVYEWYT